MLIRSQDRKQLIPLQIGSISAGYKDSEDAKRIYFYDIGSESPTSTLGLYSTEQKAIEVLDLIQEAYEGSCSIQLQVPGNDPYMMVCNTVFQMPQDKEVSKK